MSQLAKLRLAAVRLGSLGFTAIALQLTLASPAAAVPLTYQLNFNPTQANTPLPNAEFVYDAALQQFLGFTVNWNGGAYNFLTATIMDTSNPLLTYSQRCNSTGAELTFKFLVSDPCLTAIENYPALTYYFLTAQNGTYLELYDYEYQSSFSQLYRLTVVSPQTAPQETFNVGKFTVSLKPGDPPVDPNPGTDPVGVPEPGTLGLLLLGSAAILMSRRRRTVLGAA